MASLIISFYITIVERADTKAKYPYQMKLYIPRSDGFKEGDDVYLRGLVYGQISEIRRVSYYSLRYPKFSPTEDGTAVELTLIVQNPITLWDNYKVQFKTKTLFSNRHLDLDPGFPEKEISLRANPFDSVAPSTDYTDDLFTVAYDVLNENRSDLRRIVVNLESVSFKLRGKKGTLPQLINEDELYDAFDHTVYDISIAAKEGRRYIENQRETDINPVTFTMVVFFNLMGLSIIGNR